MSRPPDPGSRYVRDRCALCGSTITTSYVSVVFGTVRVCRSCSAQTLLRLALGYDLSEERDRLRDAILSATNRKLKEWPKRRKKR